MMDELYKNYLNKQTSYLVNHSRSQEDELMHWKYIKKIPVGKGFRYFYSMDELRAFYAEEAPKMESAKNDVSNKIKNTGTKFLNKYFGSKKGEKKDIDLVTRDQIDFKYFEKIEVNGEPRYFYSEDEYLAYLNREKYAENEPDFMKGLKHSDVPFDAKEDAVRVNPNYDPNDDNSRYEYNCAECTAIYELRRRGYDVESNGTSNTAGVSGENIIEKAKSYKDTYLYNTDRRYDVLWENAKVQNVPPAKNDKEAYNNFVKEIQKNPPGSRGDFSFQWKEGGGHSVVWEYDTNKNIKIIDTQLSGSGKRIERDPEEYFKRINNGENNHTRVVRTDNLRPKKALLNICQNSK